MKFYNVIIKYRLQIAIALVILGAATNYYAGFWPAFPLYFVALLLLFGYFFFGPLRLIQEHMESGDMDAAEKGPEFDQISPPALQTHPFGLFYAQGQYRHDETGFHRGGIKYEKSPRCRDADEGSRGRQPVANGHAVHAKERYPAGRKLYPAGNPQRTSGQGEPGGGVPAVVFNYDDQEGVQGGEGFLSKGEGIETDDPADRQPNKRNRAIYFEDSGVSRS